ncbi:MAG: TIGR02099 family protein [Gammaproteobacteria bacterium]|nr:MAG: TIGR02099 family protein [Pseudomonadota bacterium]PIE38194.1 MAG: TIGR02099 family protein [Gammaproteobacteria bacterium]
MRFRPRFRRLYFNYLRWFTNTVWYVLLTLTVLLAVYVALGRQFFPAISNFRPDLEAFLSRNLSSPVQIEGLTGKWNGLNPVVVVDALSFQGQGEKAFRLDSLTIELSFIDTLKSAAIKLGEFRFSGLHLHFKQQADGQWSLPGFFGEADLHAGDSPNSENSLNPGEWFQRYLVYPFVEIADSSLIIESSNGDFYTWQAPKAQLVFSNERFAINGQIFSSGHDESFSRFVIEGALGSDWSQFQARMYFDWDSGNFFNEYLDSYLWQGVQVDNFTTSGQLWMTVSDSWVSDVRGIVDVPLMQLKAGGELLDPLEELHFDVHWSGNQQRNIIKVADFGFRWKDRVWQPSQAVLSIDNEGYRAESSYLNVTLLAELLADSKILGEEGTAALKGFAPEGELNRVHFEFPGAGESKARSGIDSSPTFHLDAELAGVSVNAYDSKPQVENINGYIGMTESEGEVIIDSDNFTLGFPELFLAPWKVQNATASLYWRIDSDDVLHLGSKGIRLGFSGESWVTGDFRSVLPAGGAENWLSLAIAPHNIPAINTPDFVPFYRVDESLYQWLDKSIQSGTLVDGIYIGHGLVGSDDPSGLFSSGMYFDIDNGEVKYADTWPSLEKIKGHLTLTENALDLQVSQTEMNQVPFTRVSASQKYTGDGKKHPLTVTFHSRLDGALAEHILADYPFRDTTGAIADALDVRGTSSLRGTVTVPLSRPEESSVNLAIKLRGVDLTVPEAELNFSDVRGMLYYHSREGLSADGISMTLFEKPAMLDISTENTGRLSDIRMNLHGDISVEALSDWLGVPRNIGLTGETRFDAELNIFSEQHAAGSEVKTRLDVKSKLVGIESSLPQPFYKISPSIMDFHYTRFIEGYLARDKFRLGRKIWGTLSTHPGSTTPSITVSLMNEDIEHSAEPGLHIQGAFDTLDLDPWLEFLERLDNAQTGYEIGEKQAQKAGRGSDLHQSRNHREQTGDTRRAAESDSSLFRSANIQAKKLLLKGMTFSNLSTDVVNTNEDAWLVNLAGDQVLGSVSVPVLSGSADTRPVKIRFDRLSITEKDKMTPGKTRKKQSVAGGDDYLSIHDIPALDVEIAKLIVDGDNRGRWKFKTQHRESEIVFEPLEWQVQNSRFDGRLSWKQDEMTGHQSTILMGQANVTDLLETARLLGYNAPPLDAADGNIDLALVWPRSPQEFGFDGLSGNINVTLNNGLIVDTARSSDALKLLGILNLDTLSRRLRLDFSDLFQRGISFDRLGADANVQLGKLTLASPLVIQGPSTAFKISGNTHLVKETLDMEMVMVLPLAKNLPLAALVVGAPTVGGALWVIDTLLEKIGDPLSRFTSATYSISGSWDQPDVKLKRVFDNSLLSGEKAD